MISYSQNFEDVILDRVFRGTDAGFYVDIGAHDPERDSVTKHFYARGWRGINLEPGLIYSKLPSARPRDLNLNVAASDRAGEMTFYEAPGADGLAGFSPELPDGARELCTARVERSVRIEPLRDIFAAHAPDRIDFMSIDVEGHERQVLLGNDWTRFRPRVVLIEATLPMTQTPCHERFEDVILAAGYSFVYFDGLNRFYVRNEDVVELGPKFAAPPNVFDGFVTVAHAKLAERVGELEGHVVALTANRDAVARHRDRAEADLAEREAAHSALLAGTGGRSLRIGLWIARQLCRLGRPFAARPRPGPESVVGSFRVPAGRSRNLRATGVDAGRPIHTI